MWPFRHNWQTSYVVTYSFKTEVLVSRSGREQRRAIRGEPRRTIQTTVFDDGDGARRLDAFLWSTQADAFTHADPVSLGISTVRLPGAVTLDHRTATTGSVTVALEVEPGTDTYAPSTPDAGVYQGRYVLPFAVNWREGVSDSLFFPRQRVDFDAGRIAVDRPIAFGSRTTGLSQLRVGTVEVERVVGFFRYMRGRRGDFWAPSPLADLRVLETVSDQVTVAGDMAAMADEVNAVLRFELTTGGVYYRSIVAAGVVGGTTLISLDADFPDVVTAATIRRLAWMRVARFASDDLSVEWVTNTVAQMQVQTVTLPNSVSEGEPVSSEIQDYYGTSLDRIFDLRDYTVNTQIGRLDP